MASHHNTHSVPTHFGDSRHETSHSVAGEYIGGGNSCAVVHHNPESSSETGQWENAEGLTREHNTEQESGRHPGPQSYGIERAIQEADNTQNLATASAFSYFGIRAPDEQLSSLANSHSTIHKTALLLQHVSSATQFDFFHGMSSHPELLIELAKQLSMPSFLSLFSISRDFNSAINGHLTHSMLLASSHQAPESCTIFPFRLFEQLCTDDPARRPHPRRTSEVRKAPSLRWLQMVVHREKVVRDILACMARQGHRMPEGMSLALKKMWLVMDLVTSAQRVQLMHNTTFFTALDLYHIQMFVVKLDMRFNDPIDGPADDCLRKLFLGQRGLTPLRNCLKRTAFTSARDVIELAIKYDYTLAGAHRHLSLWEIPPNEVGIGHLEGWGLGKVHLLRPDELVMREAVRRRLDLKNHVMGMMLWGYVDAISGLNTPPTYEEKYMSDDEDVRNRI